MVTCNHVSETLTAEFMRLVVIQENDCNQTMLSRVDTSDVILISHDSFDELAMENYIEYTLLRVRCDRHR